MLLLITSSYLEIADRCMTTAVKLVLAQTFVARSTSLVRQLMGNRVLHRGPFAQRGPSTLGLHLGAQLLLELFVLADAQASALPVRSFGTLGAQGTRVTRSSWKLGLFAWDHGDGFATRTGYLHTRKVQSEQQFFTSCSDSHYDTLRLHGASVQGEMSFARCISNYCTVV